MSMNATGDTAIAADAPASMRIPAPNGPQNGVLLAFLSYAAFSFSDASIKLLEGTINSFQLAFFGALLGFAALPFVRRPGERYADLLRTSSRPLWLVRAAATAVSTVTSVIAFTRLPMPEAFALIFLMPLFITIMSVFLLKEEVGRWRWAAVVIGFLGVLVVLRPGFRELNGGHLAALAAGMASAVSVVMFRLVGPQEKRISLYGAGLFGPLVVNGLLMLGDLTPPSVWQIGFVLSYGLLAALGQALLMFAAQAAPASRIAPPQYSQMLWAVALSYLLFLEPVDAMTFVGIGIIIAAGLITWMRERIKLPVWRRRFPMRPR